MPITKDVGTRLVEAMRKRDGVRLNALRNLKAAFANELVTLKRASTETLTDDEALAVIRRQVKQRKDSIEQFRAGGREDLARAEETELRILETYLPTQMTENEIKKIAEAQKAKLAMTDKSKLGQLIGAIMKETAGRADGSAVKKVAESLF